MPSPDTIKEKLTQLPILSAGEHEKPRIREGKAWEGNEHGGHFQFYGYHGYLFDLTTGDHIPAIGYALSITGTDQSKKVIAANFIDVLGSPKHNLRQTLRRDVLNWPVGKIAYFTWLQPADIRIENDPSLVLLAESTAEVYMLADKKP